MSLVIEQKPRYRLIPAASNIIYTMYAAATINPAANTVGGLFKGERGEIGQTNAGGDIFRINEQTLNSDVTIDATENASCTGPLAVASGKTITITTGGNLSIV